MKDCLRAFAKPVFSHTRIPAVRVEEGGASRLHGWPHAAERFAGGVVEAVELGEELVVGSGGEEAQDLIDGAVAVS